MVYQLAILNGTVSLLLPCSAALSLVSLVTHMRGYQPILRYGSLRALDIKCLSEVRAGNPGPASKFKQHMTITSIIPQVRVGRAWGSTLFEPAPCYISLL